MFNFWFKSVKIFFNSTFLNASRQNFEFLVQTYPTYHFIDFTYNNTYTVFTSKDILKSYNFHKYVTLNGLT